VLVAAVAVAIAGGTGLPDAGPPATAATAGVVPAPPPAYCRIRPAPEWPEFTAGGAAPDLTAFQDYRAGLGMGAGDRGAGVTIADIEYEWRAGHVELASRALPPGDRSGLPSGYRAAEHGTAVLGVLGASEDGRGVTGLVPDATLVPVSPRTSPYQPWLEVSAAAATLGPGDVILIELQAGLNAGGAPFAPIEVYPEMRAAIRAAVDKGIVVVEPAGNGGGDVARLGEAAVPAATWLAGPSAPGHSGALIVAGGGAGTDETGTADRRRVPGSNFGARVDLQGFGAGVVTSGYGDAPWSPVGDASYTACFDGTSSAAATVAGAVAALQSAEIARDGTPLTPRRVRDLLVATGVPQADPADGWIGPRPSVSAAVAALGDEAVTPPPPPTAITPPPATGGVTPPTPAVPPVPAGSAALPAAPAISATAVAPPAARTLRAVLDRRARTLTLRLGALSRGAVVRVGTRRARVAGGRVVVRGVRRGVLLVRVTPPRRAAGSVRAVAWRVTVPARGAPRVAPVRLR